MGVCVYNETDVDMNVLVMSYIFTPTPSLFYVSLRTISPHTYEVFGTHQMICKLYVWPQLSEDENVSEITRTLRLMNWGKAALVCFGGHLSDMAASLAMYIFIENLVHMVVDKAINMLLQLQPDIVINRNGSSADQKRREVMKLKIIFSQGIVTDRIVKIKQSSNSVFRMEKGWPWEMKWFGRLRSRKLS